MNPIRIHTREKRVRVKLRILKDRPFAIRIKDVIPKKQNWNKPINPALKGVA